MKTSTEMLLARLEDRWVRVVNAPLSGTRGPLAAYRRYVIANPEFADAVLRLETYKAHMDPHLNSALTQKRDWNAPIFHTDEEEAAFGWAFIDRFSGAAHEQLGGSLGQQTLRLGGTSSVIINNNTLVCRQATAEGVRLALEIYVGPTHRYLMEHLEYDAVLLHHFERFAVWTRWFGHIETQQILETAQTAANKQVAWEKALKKFAVGWVFRDGMPVTSVDQEVEGAAGRIDFVVHLRGNRKIAVEAKILGTYGSSTYSPSGLKSAISQLNSYMNDRGERGFLVVFHNYESELRIKTGPNLQGIPGVANTYELLMDRSRRVGIILARLKPPPKPSDALAVQELNYDDFI